MRDLIPYFLGALILIAVVLLFSSFGNFDRRCRHAFPHDGLAAERCVDRLAAGGRV